MAQSKLALLHGRCKRLSARVSVDFDPEDELPYGISITLPTNSCLIPEGTEDFKFQYYSNLHDAYKDAFVYLSKVEKVFLGKL